MVNGDSPDKLEKDPIVEAIFEVRFKPQIEQAGELMPGLMYPALKHYYSKLESLPLARMPKELFQQQPDLQYQHLRRLVGEKYMVLTGEKVLSLAGRAPYDGWASFKPKILELLKCVQQLNIVDKVERLSLKYVNVLPKSSQGPEIERLKLKIQLGLHDVKENENGLLLRTELLVNNFINIVQIIPRSTVKVSNKHLTGLLLEIDTIYVGEIGEFWTEVDDLLEKTHSMEKSIFFGLLSETALKEFGPIWKK